MYVSRALNWALPLMQQSMQQTHKFILSHEGESLVRDYFQQWTCSYPSCSMQTPDTCVWQLLDNRHACQNLSEILTSCLTTVSQTKSRDHDARDYYKARRQQRLISDEKIARDVQIEDTKKRIKELEAKLTDFATAYEVKRTTVQLWCEYGGLQVG